MSIEKSATRQSNGHVPPWLKVATTPVAARRLVSAVIPTLNEERNIGWVIGRIPPQVDEIVLVDGHSTDRTVEVARAVRPDVVVVAQRGRGKGDALCTGFRHVTGDYVVVLDADGSMDPLEIDYYITALDEGYDFAKGSRFLRGGGSLDLTRLRTFGNRLLLSTVNQMWRVGFTDLCYGFFAFRRDRLPELAPAATGFEIEAELIAHALTARLRIAEVPSVELPRQYGVSHLHTWRDGNRVLRTVLRERLANRPHRIVAAFDRSAMLPLLRQVPVAQLPTTRVSAVVFQPGGKSDVGL